MANFVEWLREHNLSKPPERRCALYGMDLYSMYNSMEAVVRYLEQVSPEDAQIARKRYSRFERFQGDPQHYGHAASLGATPSLRDECVHTLVDLQKKGEDYLLGEGGIIDGDELFYAQQNASLVANAEEYYRQMFQGDMNTWNLRDGHMASVLRELIKYHDNAGRPSRAVIWAHNSHVGDSAATEVTRQGQVNVGHYLREAFPGRTFTLGFTTAHGTVTAARKWDAPGEVFTLRPGHQMSNSWEAVLHDHAMSVGSENILCLFNSRDPSISIPREPLQALSRHSLVQRYVGVVYHPHSERASHYMRSNLPLEYDAVIHVDGTHALPPLDPNPHWNPDAATMTHSRHLRQSPVSKAAPQASMHN